MSSPVVGWIAVILAAAGAAGVLLARDWRWELGFMAAQYLGSAALAVAHWPIGMAAAFLVTGWMSVAIVGMTLSSIPRLPEASEKSWPQGMVFRFFMLGMVFVLAASMATRFNDFAPGIGAPTAACAVALTGIGFLQIGTNLKVGPVVLGLFLILAGFEVQYSAVESSILVAGLLSAVMLALGLVGAYLMSASYAEEVP